MTRALPATIVALLVLCCLPCLAQDADGDGLLDAQEETLGTDPGFPETLQVILDDGPESEARRRAAGYDAGKDLLTLECGHVAGNRFLWKATFAGPPTLQDTVFHLYVDADSDATTGRDGGTQSPVAGTDYMLSVVGGGANSGHYTKNGTREAGPLVSFSTGGNCLWVSADVELGRDDTGARYAVYVLCHNTTEAGKSPTMSDSTAKLAVEGIALNDRKKIMRPSDYTESFGVTQTFGLDVIRPFLVAPTTHEVRYDQLQCDGFAVDIQSDRRYAHVSVQKAGGRVWTNPPMAGRFHLGFMMYDDYNSERVVMRINGEVVGMVIADKNNNRTWIHYLSEPRDLTTQDEVSLQAGGCRWEARYLQHPVLHRASGNAEY